MTWQGYQVRAQSAMICEPGTEMFYAVVSMWRNDNGGWVSTPVAENCEEADARYIVDALNARAAAQQTARDVGRAYRRVLVQGDPTT